MTTKSSALWRVLSRDLVYSLPDRLQVYRETVELPDGRLIDDFYEFRTAPYVVIFAGTRDGRVVVLRHYKHGPRRVHLGLPAGHIDHGEQPLAAAKRELLEETGYAADDWEELGSFCTAGNQRGSEVHAFRCRDARPVATPNAGDLEDMVIELLSPKDIANALGGGQFAVAGDIAALALAMVPERSTFTIAISPN